MSLNYTVPLANDKNGNPLQEYPAPKKALVTTVSENNTASSVVTFGHDTTAIEVAATGGSAVFRWLTSSVLLGTGNTSVVSAVTDANFDHVIPTGTVRRFVVPIESNGMSPSSVQGINRAAGLYQRIAVKSVGIASVATTEY